MSTVEKSREIEIDTRRTRKIQDCAKKIKTKFSNPTSFVQEALGYFLDMWQDPNQIMTTFMEYTKHMSKEQRDAFKNEFGSEMISMIENEEKKITESWKNKQEEKNKNFEQVENTDFTFTVSIEDDLEIQKIFDSNEDLINYLQGRSTRAFLYQAIDVFILLWDMSPNNIKNDFMQLNYKFCEIYEILPVNVINHWKENYPEAYNKFIDSIYEPWKNNIKNKKIIENEDSKIKNQLEQNFEKPKDYSNIIKKNILKIHELGLETLPRSDNAFISQFNNRFLPIKIAVKILADMIYQNKGEFVDYDAFSDECFNKILKISKQIRNEEERKEFKRNEKISTGFPSNDESKKRFLEHYIGISKNTWKNKQKNLERPDKDLASFNGALNSFGFAYFVLKTKRPNKVLEYHKKGESLSITKKDDFSIEVGITEEGLEFAGMDNILDDFELLEINRSNWKKPLSTKESSFLQKTVIPKFTFEKEISNDLINYIKLSKIDEKCTVCDTETFMCSHVIDKRFQQLVYENQKRRGEEVSRGKTKPSHLLDMQSLLEMDTGILEAKWTNEQKILLKQWRTAMMGRLSELGIIDWKISNKDDMKVCSEPGTSYYIIYKQ